MMPATCSLHVPPGGPLSRPHLLCWPCVCLTHAGRSSLILSLLSQRWSCTFQRWAPEWLMVYGSSGVRGGLQA